MTASMQVATLNDGRLITFSGQNVTTSEDPTGLLNKMVFGLYTPRLMVKWLSFLIGRHLSQGVVLKISPLHSQPSGKLPWKVLGRNWCKRPFTTFIDGKASTEYPFGRKVLVE